MKIAELRAEFDFYDNLLQFLLNEQIQWEAQIENGKEMDAYLVSIRKLAKEHVDSVRIKKIKTEIRWKKEVSRTVNEPRRSLLLEHIENLRERLQNESNRLSD